MNAVKNIKEKSSWNSIFVKAAPDLVSFEELTDYDTESLSIHKKDINNSVNSNKHSDTNKRTITKKNEKRNKTKNSKKLDLKRKKALLDEDDDKSMKIPQSKKSKKNLNKHENKTQNKKKLIKKSETKTVVEEIKSESTEDEHHDMTEWKNIFVRDELIKALKEMKFYTPTPIQTKVLPVAIQKKRDILGAAETGSGKTLAFGIPLLHHMLEDKARDNLRKASYIDAAEEIEEETIVEDEDLPVDVQQMVTEQEEDVLPALILTPTRELAIQIKDHLLSVSKYTGFRVIVVVGGMAPQKQERLLKSKPEIIIATPGRLWELLSQGIDYLQNLHLIRYLVIDEADRMLEQGHFQDLSKILDVINPKRTRKVKRQIYMFSATLTTVHDVPGRVKGNKNKTSSQTVKLEKLTKKTGMRDDPFVVDLTTKTGTASGLYEAKVICAAEEKDIYLYYFLKLHPGRTLIFTNSIDCIFHISGILSALELPVLTLHAKMQQRQRLKNVDRFTNNPNSILIASDVAARGLDIPNIEHVIHYQVPRTAETYVHRSGRSARTGKEGLSLLLISPSEFSYMKRVSRTLNKGDMPLFPFEDQYINAIRKILSVAKDVDSLSHKERKVRAHNDWFRKNAEEMEVELDDDMLILNDFADEEDHKLKQKRNQLKALLRKPVFPRNFSGKYLTTGGGKYFEPLNMNKKSDALEEVKKITKKKKLNK